MQRLSGDIFHIRVIQIITDKRMPDIFHMNTDLMGAARLQDKGDEAVPVFFFCDAIVGDCVLPFFKINFPLDKGTSGPSDGSIYGPLRGIKCSTDNGEVFPRDLVPHTHAGEYTGTYHMPGNHSQSGSVTVQPVRTPEDKRLSLLLIVVHKSVAREFS